MEATLGLHEVNTAAELVQRSVDPEANIIFGAVIDESLDEDITITVIATGFEKEEDKVPSLGDLTSKTWTPKTSSIGTDTTSYKRRFKEIWLNILKSPYSFRLGCIFTNA
ncbi:cell division protein FtsZ [human gut metagenome]|uniref:Cell division protein FtsZ n=1 Tax=human gut metagenome TaxID=408170 RepID=K1TBZ4_9ZZZZ